MRHISAVSGYHLLQVRTPGKRKEREIRKNKAKQKPKRTKTGYEPGAFFSFSKTMHVFQREWTKGLPIRRKCTPQTASLTDFKIL